MFDAAARVQGLRNNERDWVARRAAEIHQILEERQEEHLNAILRAGVPHFLQHVQQDGLDEVDEAIRKLLQVLVANDLYISGGSSAVWQWLGAFLSGSMRFVQEVAMCSTCIVCVAIVHALPIPRSLSDLILDGVLPHLVTLVVTLVDESYVGQRFSEMYRVVLEEYPSRCALHEHVP